MNLLKEFRLKAGLSQNDLATVIGVTQRHIAFLENGERSPSVETAKKIAKALDFDWTLFYQDEESATKDAI